MDTVQLILRLIAFMVTFFILLEFIIQCNVKTWIGLVGIFSAAALTAIIFALLRRYKVHKCPECGRNTLSKPINNKNLTGISVPKSSRKTKFAEIMSKFSN